MRADMSSIIGGFAVFISFIISLALLNYFITISSERALVILDKKTNFLYERSLELIDFLNNHTSALNPNLTIKNTGEIPLDPSCFKIYVNSNLTSFNYTINELYKNNLLDPGETSTIYLPASTNGWKSITLVTCRGNRFYTLINYT
jgi:archaellum component FlaF (FlaF/FlaG flagellin family)